MWRTHKSQVLGAAAAALVAVVALTACAATPAVPSHRPVAGPPASHGYTKVLVIAEENRPYGQIIGAPDAPYVTTIASTYGSATHMTANYPVTCPSLAAYILITSGSTAGICDDQDPQHHPLTGDNIFAQIDAAHLSWRTYAEKIPTPCARTNSSDSVFLVRHTPVAYYRTEAGRCAADDVELGTLSGGRLLTDIVAGSLPSYSFVTPDACHDMHGAPSCMTSTVADGDTWLSQWIPTLMQGADYRAGRLVIIITWDEGSATSNHIPTLVVSPSTHAITSGTAYTHCSTLRTTEDVLHLPPLNCAKTATSMVGAFHL